MLTDSNILIITVSFIIAIIAIYILYSIILYQNNGNKTGEELQLSTKNILEQVKVLFYKKEYALVQLLSTKYLDRIPTHIDVRIFLAKAYYEDKKYNQAIKQCKIILKKRPDDIATHHVLGLCYMKKQVLLEAIKEFEFLFEKKRNDAEITRTLAELYRETSQLYSSISAYEALAEILDLEEDIADVQTILAELNEEVRDYPAAFEAYKRRLGIYPNDIDTNKKLTELYIKIKNYPIAIETLEYMLSFVNDAKSLLWIYETMISLYVETENYDKAIEFSEKLITLQGSDKFKIRNNIALYKIKLNQITDGIEILEDLAMYSQNSYDIIVELADAYIKEKNFEKALEKYNIIFDKATPKEAKKISILMCQLYITWAIEMREQNKFLNSYDYLKNAMQYNTIEPEIYYQLGLNYYTQKNYANCVEATNKAKEYDIHNNYTDKYLLLLADAHHQLGHFFEEKKALTDLLKFDEKNSEGLYRVGIMYASQHDIKNAEEAFSKAIQYNPELLCAKYNLALLYENNNKERAKELYLEILEQDPSYEEAKRSLSEISSSDMY